MERIESLCGGSDRISAWIELWSSERL